MLLRQIFDPALAQYSYLVGCPRSGEALIIDPERDIDRYRDLVRENGLRITAVAETHIHADFVSGAAEFAADPEVRLYLSGEGGPDWTYRWPAGRPGAAYLRHGDYFEVGGIRVEAVHSPGHTPEHLSFLITDRGAGADLPVALATGDFLFVGDVGRPDLLESAAGLVGLMESSARALGESLRARLSGLEDWIQILPGHGAGSVCGKSLGAVPTTTLGYERRYNAPLRRAQSDPDGFVTEILSGQPDPPLYFARMKKVNRDGIAVTGGPPRPERLVASEFVRRAKASNARILDGRSDREAFAAGHIPGSIHAPLRSPFYSAGAGSYIEPENEILLVLDSADEVEDAARQLYRIGLDRVTGWITSEDAAAGDLFTARQERIDFPNFHPDEATETGVILDVRTTGEFARGHLDGALSIPYTRLAARIGEIPKGLPIFVHCGTGKRASLAASFLRSRGFEATHIDGICEECARIAVAEGVTAR